MYGISISKYPCVRFTIGTQYVYVLEGGEIHASVKKELVAQFDPFLRQEYSLKLRNFEVTHSCGSYRTTNHAYRISFLSTTRVRSCEQLPENLAGFGPVKYKDVLDGTLNPDYLVDIVGQIIEISHIEHVTVNGKETEKISLEFRNSDDERLPMVLWGKFACDISEAMQVRAEHSTVLEERSVNLQCHSMIEFPKDDLPLAIVESKYSAIVNGVSDKDDFFIHTPRKTIAEILETKHILFPNDDGNEEDDLKHTYYCVKYKTYNPVTLPRYKLHLVVLDNTSNTKLLVFDNHAMLCNYSITMLADYWTIKQIRDGQFHDMDTQSDAPEASLAIQGSASE
ncbi:hypothetical protein F2Q69_00023436 [Brassica cretica]|uniref:Replication protein A 70 kDa DNA-binding subunit B/D first OB fold domain-containing protein n=1 Tax=Brassica cretica TaxID=69181 RepID=A0A8S9QE08_BRACR|nr:hypothetical protein F2Q69_00023436 [Brassica cretica]